MDQLWFAAGGFGLLLGLYLAAGLWAFLRRDAVRPMKRWVLVYLCAAAAFAAALAAARLGWLRWLPAGLVEHLPLYAAVVTALGLEHLSRLLLQPLAPTPPTARAALAAAVLLAVVDADPLATGPVLLTGTGWQLTRAAFTSFGLALAWAVLLAGAALLTLRAYRRTPQPLHRNRLGYWAAALALAALGGAPAWLGMPLAAAALGAAGYLIATAALLHPRLPDARRAVYEGWAALAAVLIGAAAITGVVLGANWLAAQLPGVPSLLLYAGAALLIAVLLNPVVGWLARRLRRLAGDRRYDPRRIVGEYSLSIGNILELERLAGVALGLLRGVFGVERAALYVVAAPVADGEARLTRAGAVGPGCPEAGTLPPESPLAAFWRTEFAPLTQFEVDVEPRFAELSTAERVWLRQLGMDVYVPIYASREWIGLFALGPKRSRHRYFEEDLQLLGTLAEQTAVALHNAQLVTDLVRLNTEIKAAYSALGDANQRLTQLERTKSDFISIISHELRTPLAILFGYAQILQDELRRQGEPEHLQLVEGMTTGVTRLNEIIESMLDMAKIDSRSLELNAQPVHFEHLAQKLAWHFQWAITERNLTLHTHGLGDLPPIEGDAEALYKALHHLVVNAIKYTPDGGTITIRGRCDPDALPGGAVEITVSDTGIGIDPRFLELIFNKFYQAGEVTLHSSGKTKFKGGGPGLGLAIARGIVEAHGGRLRAESAGYDEAQLPGSRFIITLPLRRGPAPVRAPEPAEVAVG